MLMRVREQGDEIHIELTGVAGRQQSILQAVFECRQSAARHVPDAEEPTYWPEVSVRAGSNAMRICMKSRQGLRFEPAVIYHSLRQALFSGHRARPSAIA